MILRKILLCALLVCFTVSCAKKDEDDAAGNDNFINMMESAVNQVQASSSASENSNVGFQTQNVQPFAACSFAGYSCNGTNKKNIDWNACTVPNATLTGGWLEDFTSIPCCSSFTSGCGVTLTASTNGSVLTLGNGAMLSTTTEAHVTYDGTSIPGPGISVVNSGAARTLSIAGIHRVLKGSKGTIWFDHSLKTGTSLTISGTRAASNRTISSGEVDIYHNISKYKAAITFDPTDNVKWGSSTCCHPTAGTITSVFSGSLNGTYKLKYTGCGTADLTNPDLTVSNVTLGVCE